MVEVEVIVMVEVEVVVMGGSRRRCGSGCSRCGSRSRGGSGCICGRVVVVVAMVVVVRV